MQQKRMRQISFLSSINIGKLGLWESSMYDVSNFFCLFLHHSLLWGILFQKSRHGLLGGGDMDGLFLSMHLSSSSCGDFPLCYHLSDRPSLSERYQDLCIFAFHSFRCALPLSCPFFPHAHIFLFFSSCCGNGFEPHSRFSLMHGKIRDWWNTGHVRLWNAPTFLMDEVKEGKKERKKEKRR
ncbi:hypothetical protein VTN02DRAFT_581 [Thermoascus thermophilus]